MKKIMVMFMMLVAFALSAFAFSESPSGFGGYSTNDGVLYETDGVGLVGVAHADDVTLTKVDTLPLDTLP